MSEAFCSSSDPDDIETVRTGFFRFRSTKGTPWQALRVMRESGCWIVLLNGEPVAGSGTERAKDCPFLLWRAPFAEITEREYDALLRAYRNAPPGHPLRTPDQPVNWRSAPANFSGRRRDQ